MQPFVFETVLEGDVRCVFFSVIYIFFLMELMFYFIWCFFCLSIERNNFSYLVFFNKKKTNIPC